MLDNRDSCWFLNPRCYVLGGRFGDIIQCLPAFHTMGHPTVITSDAYGSVFDGVSYVNAVPVPEQWDKVAARYGNALAIQWWHSDNPIPREACGNTPMTCGDIHFNVNLEHWPSYGHSMMERLGFADERVWRNLPLVFDQRSPEREADLLCRVPHKKPLLLYNFTGISSPFGWVPEMWPLLQRAARTFTLVDLGAIRAHRIYDLLGLYDVAVGLLTCDTATLHLAPASPVPYIAFTQNGWLGSVPRGNCVLQIPYRDTPRRLQDVAAVLDKWQHDRHQASPVLVSQGR